MVNVLGSCLFSTYFDETPALTKVLIWLYSKISQADVGFVQKERISQDFWNNKQSLSAALNKRRWDVYSSVHSLTSPFRPATFGVTRKCRCRCLHQQMLRTDGRPSSCPQRSVSTFGRTFALVTLIRLRTTVENLSEERARPKTQEKPRDNKQQAGRWERKPEN